MNKDELLKIYSAYLPYKTPITLASEAYNYDGLTTILSPHYLLDWQRNKCKISLHLWDLSYLTKEIEHEGERFVPMIKLLELQETNHFSKNPIIKNANTFNPDKIIDCKSETFKIHPNEMTEHKVRYLVETSNMGTLIYSLTYDEHFDRFFMADETRNVILGVGHQRQMFEKLYEWKLNVFGLPESEYINKATLTKLN